MGFKLDATGSGDKSPWVSPEHGDVGEGLESGGNMDNQRSKGQIKRDIEEKSNEHLRCLYPNARNMENKLDYKYKPEILLNTHYYDITGIRDLVG